MKALTGTAKATCAARACPIPRSSIRATPSSRSPPARSAAPTFTSSTASFPAMESGDVLGHETMGEVVEVGVGEQEAEGRRPRRRAVHHRLRRVLLLQARLFLRLRAHPIPNAQKAEKLWGHSPAGLFGYSHLLGGYAGGQAEYLRVPYADVGPIKVPEGPQRRAGAVPVRHLPDRLHGGRFLQHPARRDTIAIWGCGPVGQFAIRSAFLLGAERVIAIDTVPERLALARAAGADDARFHEGGRLRPHPGTDQRPRRRRLHRRGRHRAGHHGQLRFAWSTGSRSRPSWAPTGRMCCARRSIAAAISARSRSSASMAASSTRSRWARPSIAA